MNGIDKTKLYRWGEVFGKTKKRSCLEFAILFAI
jgi:hypothetical protein